MRIFLTLFLAALPAMALAQSDQDAAHKADRRQTADLNRGAANTVDRRNAANAAALSRYREANQDYRRRREEWERRFAACEAGDRSACEPD